METSMLDFQPFLQWLIKSSLQSSVIILIILLVKILLSGKLTARWQYLLWALVVVRMVMPSSPQAVFSIYNLLPERSHKISAELEKPEPVLVPADPVNIPKAITQDKAVNNTEYNVKSISPAKTVETPTIAEADKSPAKSVSLTDSLGYIWLCGTAIMLVYVLIGNFRLWRIIRVQRPVTDSHILDLLEDCKSQMKMHNYLSVVETDKVNSPALFGFLRPRLLLPKGINKKLEPQQLRHVFLHELAHLKRGDIYWGWLTAILQTMHWFNPLIWYGFYRMRSDRELACDELALRAMNSDENNDYGKTIIKLLEDFSTPQYTPGLAGIMEEKSLLHRRISLIASNRKGSLPLTVAAIILFFAIGAVALTDAYSKSDKAITISAVSNKITLANGTDIELLGICQYPADDSAQWWQADGSMLDENPLDSNSGKVFPGQGQVGYVFAIKYSNVEKSLSSYVKADHCLSSTGGTLYFIASKDGKELCSFDNGRLEYAITDYAIIMPANLQSCSLDIVYADGPWQTELEQFGDFGFKAIAKSNTDSGVIYHQPIERSGKVELSVSHSFDSSVYEVRLIARDKDANILTSGNSSLRSVKDTNVLNAAFDCKLDDIKSFELQTRKYKKIKIEDIVLKPSKQIKSDIKPEPIITKPVISKEELKGFDPFNSEAAGNLEVALAKAENELAAIRTKDEAHPFIERIEKMIESLKEQIDRDDVEKQLRESNILSSDSNIKPKPIITKPVFTKEDATGLFQQYEQALASGDVDKVKELIYYSDDCDIDEFNSYVNYLIAEYSRDMSAEKYKVVDVYDNAGNGYVIQCLHYFRESWGPYAVPAVYQDYRFLLNIASPEILGRKRLLKSMSVAEFGKYLQQKQYDKWINAEGQELENLYQGLINSQRQMLAVHTYAEKNNIELPGSVTKNDILNNLFDIENYSAQEMKDMFISMSTGKMSKEKMRRSKVNCARYLQSIGKATAVYMCDHMGKAPDSLDGLVVKADLAEDMKLCPWCGNEFTWCGMGLSDTNDCNIVMAYCDGHVDSAGYNVLFVDGYVKNASSEEFKTIIAENNKLRKKAGKPEISYMQTVEKEVLGAKVEEGKVNHDGFVTVTGTITMPNSKPATGGVRVAALPMTDSFVYAGYEGRYILNWDSEWAPAYDESVRIFASKRDEKLAAIVDREPGQETIDIRLKPAIDLQGAVIDTNGNPISNASVVVMFDGKGWTGCYTFIEDSKTDKEGRFIISSLPANETYFISYFAKGYLRPDECYIVDKKYTSTDYTMPSLKLTSKGITIDSYLGEWEMVQVAGTNAKDIKSLNLTIMPNSLYYEIKDPEKSVEQRNYIFKDNHIEIEYDGENISYGFIENGMLVIVDNWSHTKITLKRKEHVVTTPSVVMDEGVNGSKLEFRVVADSSLELNQNELGIEADIDGWKWMECSIPLNNLIHVSSGDKEYILVSEDVQGIMLADGTWGLNNVEMGVDDFGTPSVTFELDQIGADKFYLLTKSNLGKRVAICIDDIVIKAPVIESAIKGQVRISGAFSMEETVSLRKSLQVGMPACN